ncbi:transposase [Bartonella refiksaydamii]
MLITQRKLRNNTSWSSSYVASSCGGTPIDIIRQYILQ